VTLRCALGAVGLMALAVSAPAAITVNYTVDGGGNNHDPLNGLAARATFDMTGSTLSVLLENTSAGVPVSFEVSDALLVSVGMNLPAGIAITDGLNAVIGLGSVGLGSWSGRVAGDSVAEQWLWTNDDGGDLMEAYAQVISTSNGQGGGTVTRFDRNSGTVDGPFGGIATNPPLLPIPANQPAVGSSIFYALTLTTHLSDAELAQVARGSIVEFGSDQRYLGVPEPATVALALLGLMVWRRRG
jgi:hypothetical protein